MGAPAAYGGTEFRPTHVVPQSGMPAWEEPDVSRPTVPLDPFLPVQLLSRRGEWGQILCANGWSAWVDGRLLVTVPQPPPTGGRPVGRAEDPLPLLARAADALDRYRQAAEELAAGRLDQEGFHGRTRGLRSGAVVDGESVWLYDEASGQWMYGDGTRLAAYAAPAPGGDPAPRAEPTPTAVGEAGSAVERPAPAAGAEAHEPTRVVTPPEAGG
ncbi:hypothetical protein [Streptomyces globosus]|uniref:hypothetical protein n=1 Tax=Streptomyces globosus TaxID=68209 RepID=UPI003818F834